MIGATLLGLTGCGANIELQRDAGDLSGRLVESQFFLAFDDGSESNPDNIDGYLNLVWTNDEKREAVVAEQVDRLLKELQANGFKFVESKDESTVIANLRINSVRYDPVGGWITDDAAIAYVHTDSSEKLGTVIADEVWVTPTLEWVINALVEGSLELWGVSSPE